MLRILAQQFVRDGHSVTVFSTQPGYNNVATEKLPRREVTEQVEAFRVSIFKENKKKLLNRAANVALFLCQLVMHCLGRFRKYDLITVASFPPTVTSMVVRWLAWINGCRYLYHCQDIYPEIAEASGLVKRKWLANLALNIDKRNCKRANAIVVLSSDMANTIAKRGISRDRMHEINNFIIDKFDDSVEIDEDMQKTPGKFRVLFAGNLGRFQSLDQIILAADSLRSNPDIQFYFVGAGAMESDLKQMATDKGLLDKNVFFRPFQPLEKVMKVINEADLSIVSLSPGVIDCAYPSKTMSYLESGCRILGLIEPHCELAGLIRDEDLGVVADSLTVDGISTAVSSEYDRWKESNYDREKIRQAGDKSFGQEKILSKWSNLLNHLQANENQ